MQDYYHILGIQRQASQDSIKKSYRRLSKKYHPDLHQEDKIYYTERFKELQEAYETLSDPSKRRFYNMQLDYLQQQKETIKNYYQDTSQAENTYKHTSSYSSHTQYQYTNQSSGTSPKSSAGSVAALVLVLTFAVFFIIYGSLDYSKRAKFKNVEKVPNDYRMDYVERYDYVDYFDEEQKKITWILKNGKYGLMNVKGKELTSIKYDWVGSFKEGLSIVQVGEKFGFVNYKGKEVVPISYDWVYEYNDDMALVRKKELWSFIDKQGKTLFDLNDFDAIMPFSEDLAAFREGGYWGFVDKTGTKVIPAVYDEALAFKNGLAPVKKDLQWGYINTKGQIAIPFQYKIASIFHEGFARVVLDEQDEPFTIDTLGLPVVEDMSYQQELPE